MSNLSNYFEEFRTQKESLYFKDIFFFSLLNTKKGWTGWT